MDTINYLLQTERKDINWIQRIFEGYDGLALVRTTSREKMIVELMIPPQNIELADRVLADLARTVNIRLIAKG